MMLPINNFGSFAESVGSFLRCGDKDPVFITHPGLRPPLHGGEQKSSMNNPLLGGVPERRGGFPLSVRFSDLRKEAFDGRGQVNLVDKYIVSRKTGLFSM